MGMRAEQTNLLCNQALLCRFSCFVHSEVPGLVWSVVHAWGLRLGKVQAIFWICCPQKWFVVVVVAVAVLDHSDKYVSCYLARGLKNRHSFGNDLWNSLIPTFFTSVFTEGSIFFPTLGLEQKILEMYNFKELINRLDIFLTCKIFISFSWDSENIKFDKILIIQELQRCTVFFRLLNYSNDRKLVPFFKNCNLVFISDCAVSTC